MYRETQEVVGRASERFVGPFELRKEREEVTDRFSITSLVNQVLPQYPIPEFYLIIKQYKKS